MTDTSPVPLDRHKTPEGLSDRIALGIVKVMRLFADAFFSRRYGHRAVVLETVAAVPGMVGGLLQHLKALRHIREDQGWIRELLDEAENERMHLMTFIHIAKPSLFERALIMVGQAIFFNTYFFLYLFAPKTAHRVVGYLEEEAVVSYTSYRQRRGRERVSARNRHRLLEACPRCPPPRRDHRRPRRRGQAPRREPRLCRRAGRSGSRCGDIPGGQVAPGPKSIFRRRIGALPRLSPACPNRRPASRADGLPCVRIRRRPSLQGKAALVPPRPRQSGAPAPRKARRSA
jgi:hypothetical protein